MFNDIVHSESRNVSLVILVGGYKRKSSFFNLCIASSLAPQRIHNFKVKKKAIS